MTEPADNASEQQRRSLLTDHERELLANDRYSPAFREQLERELLQVRAEMRQADAALEASRLRALDRLRDVAGTFAETRDELDRAVERARQMEATWQQIADAVGMTRQSAWKRWRRPDETEEP